MKILILSIVGIFLLYNIAYFNSIDVITIKVNSKERITVGSGEDIESKFIVYTENEVFENTDSFIFLKFNSTDVQNDLKNNKTFKVKVIGWRITLFSKYRNIIKIME